MMELHDEATRDWLEDLRYFLSDCESSGPNEQALRIAEAQALFVAAPELVSGHWKSLPQASVLAAMCAAGAFESAALALIGEGMGYLLSRGGNGVFLASVVLADQTEDQSCMGRTAALALLAALALALLGNAPSERRARPREAGVPANRFN